MSVLVRHVRHDGNLFAELMPEPEPGEPAGRTPDELVELLDLQKALLVTVATGGARIDEVDRQYPTRGER
jgi:hypothetical protein